MSRHVFASAVVLLFCVWVCGTCEGIDDEMSDLRDAQLPQGVDLFVPWRTLVESKTGTGQPEVRSSFSSPSLASAGGVMVAFAKGTVSKDGSVNDWRAPSSSDIVAGYIDPARVWSSLVDEINKNTSNIRSVFSRESGAGNMSFAIQPTAIGKGKKVFLLVGSYELNPKGPKYWEQGGLRLDLVVGEVTERGQSGPINWGSPRLLLQQIDGNARSKLMKIFWGSGPGIVMTNGTLVFPVTATNENDHVAMIMYSTDDGENWVLSEGMSAAGCADSRIAEWEQGTLLMITECGGDHMVLRSSDMGTTWTEAVGTLPGVWATQREGLGGLTWPLGSLITATIEGKKLMLYTQGFRNPHWEATVKADYLWVTDNSRTFRVGPISVGSDVNKTFASTLLYSNDALHFLQERGYWEMRSMFLAPLTEELNKIKFVVKTWAKLDASLSKSSIPTAGLVGFLFNQLEGDTWADEYHCANATVSNVTKVTNGLGLTGYESGAFWPVNMWLRNERHFLVKQNFTLLATVTIERAPTGSRSISLIYVYLKDGDSRKAMGLAYTHEKKWEAGLDGETTVQNSTWELGRQYQVALMLQGNKGSVYLDGERVGEEATISPDGEEPPEVSSFCFGACDGQGETGESGYATVTNVFLYNRPLTSTEMRAVKDKAPILGVEDPEERDAQSDAQEGTPAVRSAENESRGADVQGDIRSQAEAAVGAASDLPPNGSMDSLSQKNNGDAGTVCGSGVLPLLVLLGLWGLAAV